jgi:hypothetical protein
MTVEYFDVPQGSDEWLRLRLGLVTASVFKTLMAKTEEKKGRTTLLYKLAGERLTGEPMENFSNAAMEDGKEKEPILRQHYAFVRDVEVQQIGFIRNGKCGASPDGLIGEDGTLEIKRAAPHILIPMLEKAKRDPTYFPPEHFWQCQGVMMVAECNWCDLVVGYPKMPRPLIVRCQRDEGSIAELRDEIDRFDLELRRLVTRMRD